MFGLSHIVSHNRSHYDHSAYQRQRGHHLMEHQCHPDRIQNRLHGRSQAGRHRRRIFQVAVAYIFMAKGLEDTPAVTASLTSAVEPILNPIWVALVFHEVVTPLSLVGAVIVVGSVVAYNVIKAKGNIENKM